MASTPVLAPLGEHLQREWHRRTDEHRGKDGDRFWSRFGGDVHTNEQRRTGGTMTTDEERLPDPSALLGVYRFETRYRPHPSEDQASKSSRVGGSASSSKKFGPLSDELSLLVDKELGVPLRSAVMVAGEEISSSEIVEIAFDEPIPAALFRPLR